MIVSFVFAFRAYAVNGYEAHANARIAARRAPPKRRPTRTRPRTGEQVERDRGRVRGRERVPLPAPPEDERRRDVGGVRDGAVGVAALDRRLAAPVRLDVVTDEPVGVFRPARLEVSSPAACSRMGLRRRGCGSHRDPGEADVDDAARPLDVEADAEADEHGHDREGPRRPHGAESRRATAQAHPQAAREEVDEDGVDERNAPEDLPPGRRTRARRRSRAGRAGRGCGARAADEDLRGRAGRRDRRRARRTGSGASSRRSSRRCRAPSSRRPAAPSTPPSRVRSCPRRRPGRPAPLPRTTP